jgi:hypothetical protein
MLQPPFGEPGVRPMIVLISYTTNQFLIGGFFSTTSFRLRHSAASAGVDFPAGIFGVLPGTVWGGL